jgi:hypothetical protein
MQILKERALRSYHICRFVAIAGFAVAMTALCASPSFAKHHNNNNNATTTTASEVTTSVAANGIEQTTVSTASTGVDYRILADQDLDHFAIERGKAYGLTDAQIAQVAKLSHIAMEPMSRVMSRVEDGETIANLCLEYGVPINTVMDSSEWQDRISEYMTAYDNTGEGALRHGYTEPVVSSYTTTAPAGLGVGPAIMPNGTTIAPSGTAVTPNGTTIAPNGTTVEPNGATVAPNGTTVTPNGATVAPNGTTVEPNGTTTAPNGTTVSPGGDTTAPNGTTVSPGGTTTTPSGTTVAPNGSTSSQ